MIYYFNINISHNFFNNENYLILLFPNGFFTIENQLVFNYFGFFIPKISILEVINLKYFFIRKIWRNDLYLTSIFVKYNKFFFVHSIIRKIESWNFNISFFLKGKIIKSFINVNKNRLKNIFLKILKSHCIWIEIEKMMFVGLLEFSNNIYKNLNFKNFNSLSYFVFNVYLSEFDFYVFSVCYKFSKKFIFTDSFSIFKFEPQSLGCFSPLKFSFKIFNFCFKSKVDSIFFRSCFFFKFIGFKNLCYFQKFNYVRYLDFFLLGTITSKFFIFKLKYQFISFFKSNLFLFFNQIYVYSYFEKAINFLGYSLIFLPKHFYFNNFKFLDFFSKDLLFNRLFFKNLFFLKVLLNKFYFKLLFFYFQYLNLNIKNKKNWIYLFYFESSKYFCFSYFFFNRQSYAFYYNKHFPNFFLYFQKYNFSNSFYLFDRFFSDNKFISFLPFFPKVFLFSDIFIKLFFKEFSLKFSLIFYSFFSLLVRSRFLLRSFFLKVSYGFFIKRDVYLINDFFKHIQYNKSVFSFYYVRSYFSVFNIINKLQALGFLKQGNLFPIANVILDLNFYIFIVL